MNHQRRIFLRGHRIDRVSDHSVKRFRKNAITFARLTVLSALCFTLGFFIYPQIGNSLIFSDIENLFIFFSSPFYGCSGLNECVIRVLLYAMPALIHALMLLFSVTAKNKHRAVHTLLGAIQLIQGFKVSAVSVLFKGMGASSLPIGVISVFQIAELVFSSLLCIYAYRLTLCVASGFPSGNAAPGTFRRFFSVTARLFLWILLTVLIRSVAVWLYTRQ